MYDPVAEFAGSRSVDRILFVDLDGTLSTTDLLAETVLELVETRPAMALRLPVWLLQGRAEFKERVAQLIDVKAKHLVVRETVVELIRRRKIEGYRVVLATAQNGRNVAAIATLLDLFDDVLASTTTINLKGDAKLAAILDYCKRMACPHFEYVGDSRADLPIWRNAAQAWVVAPSRSLLTTLRAEVPAIEILEERRPRVRTWLRALRIHQWAKNSLLFLPALLAHAQDLEVWWAVFRGFCSFCAIASTIYLINDLADLEADRLHPTKRRRPFAAGDLPLWQGPVAAGLLFSIGFGLALTLSWPFVGTAAVYVAVNFLYSFWLKRKMILDVLVLASMYTLRIIAGGFAAGVEVSEWLRAFSLFFFASLAFLKRYIELNRLNRSGEVRSQGRGYLTSDLPSIMSFGTACGFSAVMVLSLYITSDKVKTLYRHSDVLWLVCPLLLYWLSRTWTWADRGAIDDDPVSFALKDRTSWLILLATALAVALAI